MNEQELQLAVIGYIMATKKQPKSEQEVQAIAQEVAGMKQSNPQQYQQLVQMGQQAQQQQAGAKVAALGSKLNYIRKIKGLCPEGEELVYMKEGGRVCPKCIKKAQKGTQTPKKEEKKNPVQDFKAKRKKLDPKTTKNLPNGKYPSDWDGNDRMIWEREHGSHDEGAHVVKNKGVKKNLCGGKTKKK